MRIDRPIAIAVILLVVFLLIFFFVVPSYNELQGLQLDLAQKKAEFNAQYEYYANINDVYRGLKNKEEDLKKINDALPEEPNLGNLVYFFQKETKESGLIMSDIALTQQSKSAKGSLKNVNELVFSLSLKGDYKALVDFVVLLERSAKLFEVLSITFGSGGTGGEEGSTGGLTAGQAQQAFSFKLQIKTFSY